MIRVFLPPCSLYFLIIIFFVSLREFCQILEILHMLSVITQHSHQSLILLFWHPHPTQFSQVLLNHRYCLCSIMSGESLFRMIVLTNIAEEIILILSNFRVKSNYWEKKKSLVLLSVELMLHYVASDELEQEMPSNLIMQMACRMELMIIAVLSR